MGLLCDSQIRDLCLHPDGSPLERAMIRPFEPGVKRPGVISYGLSSYGYDLRVGRRFKVFTNLYGAIADPKHFDPTAFVDIENDYCIIPPNSFALAESVERFDMPKDVLAIALGKSTYARTGIIVNVTPLEPSWAGVLTVEVSNTTPIPAKVYANEGLCQLLFLRGDRWCERTYEAKGGKYMGQTGLTLPRVDGNERGA
jgi:dCTP deaminase